MVYGASDGLQLFDDNTLLKDLPKQVIIRIDRDVLVPAGTRSIYFLTGQSTSLSSNCFLGSCRRAVVGDLTYFEHRQPGDKLTPLVGCEIVLKNAPTDASVLQSGTMLETDGVESAQYRAITTFVYPRERFNSGEYRLFTVTFRIRNSQVASVRCGSESEAHLSKKYFQANFGSVSLHGPPLKPIE